MKKSDSDARVRLEGAAELLEATRQRYRVLVQQLRSLRWQQRLRHSAQVLREVVRAQPEVEDAIEKATRHEAQEAWPASSPLRKCLHEVREQRQTLETLTLKRLGSSARGQSLTARLEILEHQQVTAPRVVLPGQRWATALQVLPWPSSELKLVARFGEELEALWSRPAGDQGQLLCSLEELDHLAAGWGAGSGALQAVWSRLEALDVTGVLVRYLGTRAKRTPAKGRANGPQVLLHATFWRSVAHARLEAMCSARLGPLQIDDDERFAVVRWLWQVERSMTVGLTLRRGEARAALCELAFAINRLPPHRHATEQWPRLLELAERADASRDDADWGRLKANLTVLAQVLPPRSNQKQSSLRAEVPESLVGALQMIGRVRR